jgi:hypothetical protein
MRNTIVVGILGIVLAASACKGQEPRPRPTPPPPLPVPNGYDDLIRAAGLVQGIAPNVGKIAEADVDQLRGWVRLNSEALIVVREGLEKPSRVAVVYDQNLQLEMNHMSGCRNLGRLLAAEAEVAIKEDRPADAARSYLDGFRLSQATGRGGLLIDFLGSLAIERLALEGLGRIRDKVPADDARRAILVLLAADSVRPTLAEVFNDDRYWFERTNPLGIRIAIAVNGKAIDDLLAPARESTKKAIQDVQKRLRGEVVNLAKRLYRLEKGAEPPTAEDLVPAYLVEIPKNPVTGKKITDPE